MHGGKNLIKTMWSITLSVSNLEKSKKFYEDILGLNKKYEYPSYVGFECGGVEIGLRPKSSVEIGKDAASIQFLVNDVDREYQELIGKGVEFTSKPHDEPWGGRQASFRDPDGNLLEITEINWKKYFKASLEGATERRIVEADG